MWMEGPPHQVIGAAVAALAVLAVWLRGRQVVADGDCVEADPGCGEGVFERFRDGTQMQDAEDHESVAKADVFEDCSYQLWLPETDLVFPAGLDGLPGVAGTGLPQDEDGGASGVRGDLDRSADDLAACGGVDGHGSSALL
jgi:hypothetical protein